MKAHLSMNFLQYHIKSATLSRDNQSMLWKRTILSYINQSMLWKSGILSWNKLTTTTLGSRSAPYLNTDSVLYMTTIRRQGMLEKLQRIRPRFPWIYILSSKNVRTCSLQLLHVKKIMVTSWSTVWIHDFHVLKQHVQLRNFMRN